MRKPKIAFFTEGLGTPASRFRVEQFLPYLADEGFDVSVTGAYGPRYARFAEGPMRAPYQLFHRGKRALAQTFSRADLLVLQRTAMAVSALPEELLSRAHRPYVFDFDDAIFLDPSDNSDRGRRRRAFETATRNAVHVIAGNAWLRQRVRNPLSTVLPTVVDTDMYRLTANRNDTKTIGWMGSFSNLPHLLKVVPAVRVALASFPDWRLSIVSNRHVAELDGIPQIHQSAWTASSESEQLAGFAIGIMPLPDDALTRGKCAFKLIQYMAHGVPVLGSEVGANREVITQQVGRMVAGDEWTHALVSMMAAPLSARREMGHAGRLRVEANYSIRSVLPKLIEILRRSL